MSDSIDSQNRQPVDLFVAQAPGLIADSSSSYFDAVSKQALKAQSVLVKRMVEHNADKLEVIEAAPPGTYSGSAAQVEKIAQTGVADNLTSLLTVLRSFK